MRSLKLGLMAMAVITAGLFAFTGFKTGNVKGVIDPSDGAVRAWAISTTDTARADITNGAFTIDVKEGTYNVVIEAVPPYKNLTKEGVQVSEGASVDLGVIKLEQ